MSTIAVDHFLYSVVIGHLDDRREHLQPGHNLLFCILRIDVGKITRAVWTQIGLGIVEVEETVEFIGHGLGQFNLFFLSFFVGHCYFCLALVFVVFNIHLGVYRTGTCKKEREKDYVKFSHFLIIVRLSDF